MVLKLLLITLMLVSEALAEIPAAITLALSSTRLLHLRLMLVSEVLTRRASAIAILICAKHLSSEWMGQCKSQGNESEHLRQ